MGAYPLLIIHDRDLHGPSSHIFIDRRIVCKGHDLLSLHLSQAVFHIPEVHRFHLISLLILPASI